MSLKEAIEVDFKQALLSRDKLKTDTLKMVKSAILNEEIAKNKREQGLDDDEVVICLKKEVKKRADAASLYERVNSQEKAKKELDEIKIIEKYLPEPMTDKEVLDLIKKAFANHTKDQKNLGKVISEVVQKSNNRADGSQVAKLAKDFLDS